MNMNDFPVQQNLVRKDYKRLSDVEIQEIIVQKNNGVSAAQIAQQFQCSERQIHRILKKNLNGELIKREKKESDSILQKLDTALLQEHHYAWIMEETYLEPNLSVEIISDRLSEQFNARISVTTVWRNQKNISKIVEELKDNENIPFI